MTLESVLKEYLANVAVLDAEKDRLHKQFLKDLLTVCGPAIPPE